jgi:segregation and condensation protein B
MDDQQAKRIIEALLFVFSNPLPLKRITEILPDLEPAKIRVLIQTLNGEYEAGGRAFRIQEIAGGYQAVTDQSLAPWIKKALQSPRPDSVSVAALETLAIVAYRQPTTKAEIEAVRGVDVSASLDTLVERKFVRLAGRKESPGRPFLYATTPEFLRHFGLKSLEALPKMELPAIPEPEDAARAATPSRDETTQPASASAAVPAEAGAPLAGAGEAESDGR